MASPDPPFTNIRYLPTTEAYDRWAKVYDTDGNFLQAMDNIEMKTLFPAFVSAIRGPRPWRLVDLGCGTGRNTMLLCGVSGVEIVALDASSKMLDAAETRLRGQDGHIATASSLSLGIFDILDSTGPPQVARQADGIISTLVLEHIPLDKFFPRVSQILKPGGVLLITNMHSDMGGISQAGFVDTDTGEKIRPTSYAHTVGDVVAAAARWGLEVEDGQQVMERVVTEEMVGLLGPRSTKWVGVTCWFGALFRKRGMDRCT